MILRWRDLSVVKKLYLLTGIMATLIASELFTLFFAMNTLSSVRAFVAAEGQWTKAQKDAIHSLYQFALTGDPHFYDRFNDHLKVTAGDHIARLEITKEDFDEPVVRHALLVGANHNSDVKGMIRLLVEFKEVNYIKNALAAWTQADLILDELRLAAADLKLAIQAEGKNSPKVAKILNQVATINTNLTQLENNFSASLSEGSRWLENFLMIILILAVLTVETTAILLTYRFSRNLSRSLKELIQISNLVGRGNFSQLVPVRSNDETGQLAMALNQMIEDLKISHEKNDQADRTLLETKEKFRLQQLLVSSESKLHQIIEATPSGILMVDQQGVIVLCNMVIENLFNYSRVELIGMKIENLVPERYRDKYVQHRSKFFIQPQARRMGAGRDLIGLRKNGTEFPVEVGLNPVETNEGQFVLASIVDITERKKIAEDLLVVKEQAEAANLAKSAFLANMSHEIRTPLGAIMGFADLVIDPEVRALEKINFVDAIKRNGELLSNIINDILDLSKIEAGKMQFVTEDVNLTDIISDTKIMLELQAQEKGIALSIHVEESAPDFIKTDPLRLRQVLINIIGNAIKFTSRGSVEVNIRYEPFLRNKKHGLLSFIVKDTGRGIHEEQIEKLFAPFSQLDSTSKRKYGGTGLGLVLAKRFANLLGGDVVLTKSVPGLGSTFTISIDPGPIQKALSKKEVESKINEFQFNSDVLKGIHVLLAEDSADNQLVVSRFLKLAGAQVDIVSNGEEAVEKANLNKYDVLLMDLQMPVMDGFEATAKLRQQGYKGSIIALTAHTLNEDRQRCLQSGFSDHLGKPVNRQILIKLLTEQI